MYKKRIRCRFRFLCSSLLLHFVALPFVCLRLCAQTSFNSVFLCRLAAFVERAMQETQPTRSKAKFQLNQRTVQPDREPSERTNEPSVDGDVVGKQREREREQRRPNEEQQTEIEIQNTHTHTRTHGRQSEHAHTHTDVLAHTFRFVCVVVGGWIARCCGRRRCDAGCAADSEVACAVLLLRVGGCWGGLVG